MHSSNSRAVHFAPPAGGLLNAQGAQGRPLHTSPAKFLCIFLSCCYFETTRSDCQKTSLKTCATEQRGVCAGGKKPTARSIKQDFETFLKVSKSALRGEKTFSTRCGSIGDRPVPMPPWAFGKTPKSPQSPETRQRAS